MRYLNKAKSVFLILLFAFSCTDSDVERELEVQLQQQSLVIYNAWGFVSVSGTEFYIKTDTKKVLKLKDFDNSSIGAKQGDRIFMTFSIPQRQAKEFYSTTYDYEIIIKTLLVVDYEGITVIKGRENVKIPNGFVKVEGIDISADNLNLKIVYNESSQKKPAIKLCYDENLQRKNKPLLLELKDSVLVNQKSAKKVTKLQSYNIRQLEKFRDKDDEGKIEFVVVTNRGTVNQEQFNMVYNP